MTERGFLEGSESAPKGWGRSEKKSKAKEPSRTCILVLGMHRSGTSALTRAMNLLGAEISKKLISADANNETGYWEPEVLNILHNEMLTEVGSGWADWRSFNSSDLGHERAQFYQSEIARILEEDFVTSSLFLVKDPRISRFVAFYADILQSMQIGVRYVLAIRSPLSVIASLSKRDGFTFGFSALVWLRHQLDAERATRGQPRVFVSYEAMIRDWRHGIAKITKALSIAWPRSIDTVASEIDGYLSADHQHHVTDDAQLLTDDRVTGWVKDTYTALKMLEAGGADAEAVATLDRVKAEFDAAAPVFGDAFFPEIVARQSDLTQARDMLQTLADRRATEIERLKEEKKLRDAQARQLADEWAAEIERLEKDRDNARSEEYRLQNVVDEIYSSASWRVSSPVRVIGRGLRAMSCWARPVWHRLPLTISGKRRLKNAVFRSFPFIFGRTSAYRAWLSLNGPGTTSVGHELPGAGKKFSPPDTIFVPRLDAQPLEDKPARVVAFYLPQFHPIPENDKWWGVGFTEWSNVRPARPQFVGHYQPHKAGDLGYYDLTDKDVVRSQIELAKLYGIEGFCFYFYWFGGKRLLEKPLENWLQDQSLDLPFCLCWANENWSRRWDGLDREVLIAQRHSPEDDIAFITEIAPYLRDARYIRIGGKPLLLVYRPSLLPSAEKTAKRWRKWCRENGIGEIYLAYAQAFENPDPRKYGFDAAVEFPPNNSAPPDITSTTTPIHGEFGSNVYDWSVFPKRSENYRPRKYSLFRSVCPGWDNTARRKKGGAVFVNNTPELFRRWLENAIRDTVVHVADPSERLIFVNAWNEWAEGAHLEPDEANGYAYLQATRDALTSTAAIATRQRIVVVSHDAHPHGAQKLAMNMARGFGELGFDVDLIVLGDGAMLPNFARVAAIHRINLSVEDDTHVLAVLKALRARGVGVAIVNTTASGLLVPFLKNAGFRTVCLVHELPGILKTYKLEPHVAAIAQHADKVIFPAKVVQRGFEEFLGAAVNQAAVRPQGSYMRLPFREKDRSTVRGKVRNQLGLKPDARIILSVGYGDHRKGLDLFVDACMSAMARDPRAAAVWVGHFDTLLFNDQLERIRKAGLADRFVFTGLVEEPQEFFFASDVYALTSREDPFPSVVMEALDANVPVVAFRGGGGYVELLSRNCGVLVPAFDAVAMGREIKALLRDTSHGAELAAAGRAIVEREFRFPHYLRDLLDYAGVALPRVSVIVPNYNYARYIEQRLKSIQDQTIAPYELIVLDDDSSDDSVERVLEFLSDCPIPSTLVVNEKNSGSVFLQWLRGVELARGDFVWIAEADDFAAPEFLADVLPPLATSNVLMSYCQSRQVDGEGDIMCNHYLDYVADIDPKRWTEPYIADGREEIARALFIKNTVPNVSAAVFRRQELSRILSEHAAEIMSFRNAGDWVAYMRLLEHGAVAFSPNSLNSHRRHHSSVTVSNFNVLQLREIVRVQRETIKRHDLGALATQRANDYAQRLYEQFGLATGSRPRFEDDPEIFETLSS